MTGTPLPAFRMPGSGPCPPQESAASCCALRACQLSFLSIAAARCPCGVIDSIYLFGSKIAIIRAVRLPLISHGAQLHRGDTPVGRTGIRVRSSSVREKDSDGKEIHQICTRSRIPTPSPGAMRDETAIKDARRRPHLQWHAKKVDMLSKTQPSKSS